MNYVFRDIEGKNMTFFPINDLIKATDSTINFSLEHPVYKYFYINIII